ncbi:hypothetical protein [uncultured Winogradskyella sp.]|uniref:hypothetical protein n=1 Tax=uncultured Winogradskyella sp. TaxID=395353 RepID=UPI00351283A8
MKKLIIIWAVTILVNVPVIAQDWATVDIINEELKGMMFSAKIDYAPDCEHATPFIRATLHSITVDRFTYNGEEYYGNKIQGVDFPIEVTGYLSISTRISMGYHKDQRTYELNKTSLSTSIGGKGNEFMADEFRFADGETAKLKEHLNISSCVDLKANATYLAGRMEGGYIEVHDGDLRYKDQSLHLYLKNKLEKQLEQQLKFTEVMEETAEYLSDDLSVAEYKKAISKLEGINTGTLDKYQKNDIENRLEKLNDYLTYAEEQAIEKKYDYLNTYRVFSNKQTPDFYENGIKKTEELIKNTKNKEEKAYLESLVQRIRYNYDAAEKNKASRDNLKAELKRDENKRKMEKTRLNQEEIKRLNAQRQYLNKVRNLESQGFNSETAHKMAQNESKIQAMDELGTSVSNAVAQIGTDLIYAAFDKKEREYKENWAKFEAYRDAFENKVQNIREASTEKNKAIRELPMTKEMSDNIPDLMQEVLWYVENVQSGYGVSSFEYPSGWGSVVSYGKIITQTTVDDAYFEGDKLFIQVTKKCLEASYDKDNLKRSNIKKVSPQPAKYTLKTKIEYDLNTAQTKTYRNIHWVGRGYYPAANAFEESNNFRTKVKNFDKALYAPPNYDKTVINVYARKRLRRIREIEKQLKRVQLSNNIEFTNLVATKAQKDLNGFDDPYYKGPSYLDKTKVTSNPEERVMIRFWKSPSNGESRYILLSYPGKDIFDKVHPNKVSRYGKPLESWHTLERKDEVYYSTVYPRAAIASGIGLDLVLNNDSESNFTQNVVFYKSKNAHVKDLNLPDKLSPDIWMPIVEVGRVQFFIEYDYIKDKKLLQKLKDKGVADLPLIDSRESAGGIVCKLSPLKKMVIHPALRVDYQLLEKKKYNRINNIAKDKGDYYKYKAGNYTKSLLFKYYKSNRHNINLGEFKTLRALDENYFLFYSEDVLENTYDSFQGKNNGEVYNQPVDKEFIKGLYYNRFVEFSRTDLTETGIRFQGRKPTYYDNGNLKTVGNTKDGKKYGIWEYYNPEGKLTEKNEYIANILVETLIYDENEVAVMRKRFYSSGALAGHFTFNPITGVLTRKEYNSDGIISVELDSEADNIFDQEGKLIEKREFEFGILTNTIKY